MTQQERDAWAAAYRLYDEFAPGLRQAAVLADDNEMACRLFMAASVKSLAAYEAADAGGRIITVAAYGILQDLFKAAQAQAERPQEARISEQSINTSSDGEERYTA